MSWESMGKVGTVTTIVCGAIALATYVFTLEWRIATLSSQTQAALTLPSPKMATVAEMEKMSSSGPNVSTIEATCSRLAIQSASLEADNKLSASSGVQSLMTKLGCFK